MGAAAGAKVMIRNINQSDFIGVATFIAGQCGQHLQIIKHNSIGHFFHFIQLILCKGAFIKVYGYVLFSKMKTDGTSANELSKTAERICWPRCCCM